MDFYIILETGLVALLYARIVRVVWRKAGKHQGISKEQVGAFAVGLAAVLIARIGPIDTLSDTYFSAYVVRSLLLALAAPAMLVTGLPGEALHLAVPHGSLGRWSSLVRIYPNMKKLQTFSVQPLPAWVFHAAALCLWLQPSAYQVTQQSEFLQSFSHFTLFAAGLLFWISFMQLSRQARLRGPRRVTDALLSAAALVMLAVLLGWLIAFTPYAQPGVVMITSRVGVYSGLEDRQLAGMLLWLLAGGAYMGAIWSAVRRVPLSEAEAEITAE